MSAQTAILFNSPALHALQRKQLVNLCKRHHIKVSGKNTDLIRKLQAFGEQLPATVKEDPTFAIDSLVEANCPPPASSSPFKAPRPSEPWSVLEGESADSDDDGGSAGAMQVDEPDAGEGTVKGKGSWKSAENGQSQLNEFGIPRSTSGSSLSRSTSKTLKSLLSRSLSRSAGVPRKPSKSVLNADMFKEPPPASPVPQSPEPGIARAMRPSIAGEEPTIRMVEASPSATKTLYPQLPVMEDKRLAPPAPVEARVPGGFPASAFPTTSLAKTPEPPRSPAPPAFVFGSPMPARTAFDFRSPEAPTTFSFSSMAPAAVPGAQRGMRAVVEDEMRKLMAQKGVLDAPPPKPVENLFSREVFESLGGKKDIKKRRFDDIHEKEFSKMPSILDHHSARRAVAAPKASTSRISSTATLRRPRQSTSTAAGPARRQQTGAGAGARRPSALPTSAASRVRAAPIGKVSEQADESQNGRAAKKIKVDRPVLAAPAPVPVKPAPPFVAAPVPVASAATIPKSKSSRFGFLAHGVESVKAFASGLSKPSAGPAAASLSSMPRSVSATSIPKLKSKMAAPPPPPPLPPPAVAAKRFGFGLKDKAPTGGMTQSDSFQTRPGSTLFAPTASSLAKQAAPAVASLIRAPSVKRPVQALPVRSSLASARLPLPSTATARVVSKQPRPFEAAKAASASQVLSTANPPKTAAVPAVAVRSPLAASRPSVTNAPAPPSSSKTPLKRGPQFKARVALKLSSQRAAAAAAASGSSRRPSATLSRTPGRKNRSSVSAALVNKPLLGSGAGSGLHARASGAVPAKKKGRESVPVASSSSSAGAPWRHSAVGGLAGLKARGRSSELVRHKPASMLALTPKKILPKAPTTPFFPAVPLGGIDE